MPEPDHLPPLAPARVRLAVAMLFAAMTALAILGAVIDAHRW